MNKNNGFLSGTNTILAITCSVIIALVVASSFTQTAIFPFGQRLQELKISVFAFLIILFSVVQFIFLRSINKINQTTESNVLGKFSLTKIHKLVTFSQLLLIAILALSFAQVTVAHSYNLIISIAVVWITHVTTIGLLSILAYHFLNWFINNRDLRVLLFAIALIVISINLIFLLAYFTYESRDDPLYITPFRGQVTAFSSPYSFFEQGYFITYIMSFVAIWSATVSLLYNYSKRIGTIKFWIVVGIPLVYFTLQFQTGILEVLLPFRLDNPTLFGVLYTLIFSAAKPIGGILAGIAFWTIAKTVNQNHVRYCMMLSACGIMLLFASNQGSRLVTPSFPPIELGIVSFMILAAYFFLVGIYFSAISVAQDTKLRRYVIQSKKSIEKQLGFLGSIGSSEVEQEVQKRVETVTKNFVDKMQMDTGVPTSLDENEIRDYIQAVIKEKKQSP
jgi:hypothetical protein